MNQIHNFGKFETRNFCKYIIPSFLHLLSTYSTCYNFYSNIIQLLCSLPEKSFPSLCLFRWNTFGRLVGHPTVQCHLSSQIGTPSCLYANSAQILSMLSIWQLSIGALKSNPDCTMRYFTDNLSTKNNDAFVHNEDPGKQSRNNLYFGKIGNLRQPCSLY